MVKAISFDVGETLLRPFPGFGELAARCCAIEGEMLGPDASAELERFADTFFSDLRIRGETYSRSEEESRRIWTSLYRQFLESQEIRPANVARLADQLYLTFTDTASYRLFDDARPVLAEFRRRGFRIGIISNWEAWLSRLLVETGLDGFVHFQAISGVVGFEKPHRQIFESAMRDASLPAWAILHVGDSLISDVHGAQQVGMQAVLLDRHGRQRGSAVARVETLHELLAMPELERPT
ncbi:MAG TPA: HAD-IA family hydrolase [Chloroflexota bacterium]|nr:HAD-IA family hydrolase [Chloroflexota bacterium]